MPQPSSAIQASLQTQRIAHAGNQPTVSINARVALSATSRANTHEQDYRLDAAPRSPHPKLSGNHRPEDTRLAWLKNRYKCNQFVGDVLFEAGVGMPTFRMPDGSLHYVNAEALPAYKSHFSTLRSPRELQAGDVIVIDRLTAAGENGAHVEIVTNVRHDSGILEMTGARRQGATKKDYSNLYRSLRMTEAPGFSTNDPKVRVIALRARLSLN